MGFDWEQLLGATGSGIAGSYDEIASDALCRSRPATATPGGPIDLGDEILVLPFAEL
jgi:hypothetical protein